jgi:hypothetical protein
MPSLKEGIGQACVCTSIFGCQRMACCALRGGVIGIKSSYEKASLGMKDEEEGLRNAQDAQYAQEG